MGLNLVFDVESNGLLDVADTIWTIQAKELGKDNWFEWRCDDGQTMEGIIHELETADATVSHNGVAYDIPLLDKLYGGFEPQGKIVDTLVMSRVLWPDRPQGHSLKAWGNKLEFYKGEYAEEEGAFDQWDSRMVEYCRQDVRLTESVYYELLKEMEQ